MEAHMSDISLVTGEKYYSGDWTEIQSVAKSLKMGEGKLAIITQELVNKFQERADRQIDGELEHMYYTPIRAYNVYMPGINATKSVFPGMIRKIAIYLSAGLLLTSEFQQNEPNMLESAQKYIDDAKRDLFEIVKFTRRIPGAQLKHRLKTMLPTMAPGYVPELNI
jgi:hypothetical protein